MSKMKLLAVQPFLPYPIVSGGHQAMFNGLYCLKDDVELYLAYRESKDVDNQGSIKKLCELMEGKIQVLPFRVSENYYFTQERTKRKLGLTRFINRLYRRIGRSLGFAQSGDPIMQYCESWSNEFAGFDKGFADFLNSIILEKRIDLVQCEMLDTVLLPKGLCAEVKKLFVHHEIGTSVHELEIERNKWDEKKVTRCLNKYRKNEVRSLNQFDGVVTLSKSDSEKLHGMGVSAPVFLSFAVVNAKPIEKLECNGGTILTFVGPECHSPNVAGIKWFLETCWEKLRSIDESYELRIIGKWSEKTRNSFKSKYGNVVFLGYVDDLRQALENTIMIVPIQIGSGIRMKILEAASLGVPFVSTSVGAEGIPVESGCHCHIADTPESFINSILQLKNKDKRIAMAQRSYQLVHEHYSLEALRSNRMEVYRQLLNS